MISYELTSGGSQSEQPSSHNPRPFNWLRLTFRHITLFQKNHKCSVIELCSVVVLPTYLLADVPIVRPELSLFRLEQRDTNPQPSYGFNIIFVCFHIYNYIHIALNLLRGIVPLQSYIREMAFF